MKQYLNLLKEIQKKGTIKPAARSNMPSTQSYFGPQFRHNLADGFPILTTKKIFWKGVVTELLWFLRGDTNIKYLVDNGINIWNEDAYNYYCKIASKNTGFEANKIYRVNVSSDKLINGTLSMYSFDEFCSIIKQQTIKNLSLNFSYNNYTLGDCGYQYGKVWRNWNSIQYMQNAQNLIEQGGTGLESTTIDQIKNLINGLKTQPEGRRHILTAIDPAHDTDLALYWCHCLVQFNCRPISKYERKVLLSNLPHWKETPFHMIDEDPSGDIMDIIDEEGIPKYYLDCQLYQRSADTFLGVPFNITSYALLTEILAKMCNMVAGEFIHTFGDAHIYENHKEAVKEQLSRTPTELPKLNIMFKDLDIYSTEYLLGEFLNKVTHEDFTLSNYNPQSTIRAELSTGMKK